ncbi:MAG TPA: hypothetical protein VFM70_04110 [Salinimicrobium sp.]|nr:hypothetical protein [Salinimicrobium sp.]
MEKKLFLISTPSQAFFLKQSPELINKAVLVIAVPTNEQKKKILYHLKGYQWTSIHVLKIPQSVGKFSYIKILGFGIWLQYFKLKYPSFNEVFFGSYNNHYNMSLVAEYENSAKLHLLYDGMQMVAVSQSRKEKTKGIRPLPSFFKFLGLKQAKINKLNFIGPLPIKVEGEDTYSALKNEMSYKHPIPQEDTVVFVGQPLIGNFIINEDFYYKSLLRLKEKFPDKHFIYAPHHREKVEHIQEIKKIMDIAVFSEIFEEKFISSEKFPGTVITFYSSALLNLCYLQAKIKLYAIKIPYSKFIRKDVYPNYEVVLNYIEESDYPYLSFLDLKTDRKKSISHS